MALTTQRSYPLPYATIRQLWSIPGLNSTPFGYTEMTGVDPVQQHELMLEKYGTPELNNEGGVFQPALDFGTGGYLLFWFGAGFVGGRLYRHYLVGTLPGLTIYPLVLVAILETPRLLYLSSTRSFPALVALSVLAWQAQAHAKSCPAAGPRACQGLRKCLCECAVNGRYLLQRMTGVQRYAREIVARLGEKVEVIAPRGTCKGVRGHLWEQAVLPCRMGRSLLWSPSATGPLAVSRQVVTVHDCAFFEQSHCFSRAFAAWYQYLVPRLVRSVRRTITVSEFSRQRIVELCRVSPDRVVAIHSGVDPRFRPQSEDEIAIARSKLSLPARYVLCVGSLEPRKNLARLLQAWQRVQHRVDGLSLVLAGAKGGRVFGDAGLTELGTAVHAVGYVSDELLPAVSAGAALFIYPSLYEGFGLPVLEAMACGVPVITSHATALPEVTGEAALLVDPLEVESIADGILQFSARRLCETTSGGKDLPGHSNSVGIGLLLKPGKFSPKSVLPIEPTSSGTPSACTRQLCQTSNAHPLRMARAARHPCESCSSPRLREPASGGISWTWPKDSWSAIAG